MIRDHGRVAVTVLFITCAALATSGGIPTAGAAGNTEAIIAELLERMTTLERRKCSPIKAATPVMSFGLPDCIVGGKPQP